MIRDSLDISPTIVGLTGAFVAPIAGVVVDLAGFEVAFGVAGGLAVCGAVLAWWAAEPTG